MSICINRVMVTPTMLSNISSAFLPLQEQAIWVVHNEGNYPMKADELSAWLGDANAAIIGMDEVTYDMLEACPHLRVIARNGVGMDTVDLDAATRHDVIVTTPLGANSTSVAELAMGLLLSLARRIVTNHNLAQRGNWCRVEGMELAGKTMGIIGLGRIGKKVARRAQAFNMQVIANDIVPDHYFANEQGIPMLSFKEVLEHSDIISLHVPLTPLTRHMIDEAALGVMKRGSYLINTARGDVVDITALVSSLDAGHVAGVALDVYSIEGIIDPSLLNRINVITTTHLGAYTHESLQYTTEMAVKSIIDIVKGKMPTGILNPQVWQRWMTK